MPDQLSAELRDALGDLFAANPDGVSAADLGEFGWLELYADDPRLAVSLLFEELGRHAASAAGLELLVAAELGDLLPDDAMPAVLVPDAAGARAIGDGADEVTGIVLAGGDRFDHLVAVGLGATPWVRVLSASGAVVVPVCGIDPSARAARVRTPLATVVEADTATAERVAASVRRAVAFEQLGLGREMLRVAVEHVSSRIQFGQPLGVNQSVQHRLADVHVALKAAAEMLEVSWEESGALEVEVAAALAVRATDVAIRSALQVCGGMGFTEEFALAPLVRRSLLLTGLFHDDVAVVAEVGRRVSEAILAGAGTPRLGSFADAPLQQERPGR